MTRNELVRSFGEHRIGQILSADQQEILLTPEFITNLWQARDEKGVLLPLIAKDGTTISSF